MNNQKKQIELSKKLSFLIKQKEGASLEFKQEMYKIDIGGEGEKRQKGELTKDIVSLANGNTSSVGETAHLIIGVMDTLNAEGSRDAINVDATDFSASRLLDIVNDYIEPKLVDIRVEPTVLDGKNIVVVSIPSTPYLFETVEEILETPKRVYPEYTVFIRENERSRIASTKEREAIRKLKEIYYSETRNPSPIPFGAVIGALSATLLGIQLARTQLGTPEGQLAGGVAGFIFGGLIGGIAGSIYRDIKDIKANWHRKSRFTRILAVLIPILVVVLYWILSHK